MGKLTEKYLAEAASEYEKRLKRFCSLTITQIPDFADSAAVAKESEGILKAAGTIDFLLDIGGELVTSEGLSAQMAEIYLKGRDAATFVIGGSRGVDQSVRAAAKKAISFGRVTYPHQIMRVLVLEQVYRAFTIESNMPYHK